MWHNLLFRTNIQGDVCEIFSSDGTSIMSIYYDAWGNFEEEINCENTQLIMLAYEAPFRYRSYYYDSELSMYYLNTRYYDAKMYRFINADEVSYLGANGDLQAFNLFAYCSNNPVMYFDPCGTLAQEFIISSWWITQVDGPLPVMDILFGALAITLVVVDIAVQEGTLDLSKVETKEKDLVIPKTKKEDEKSIYYGADCYGGTFNIVTSAMTLEEATKWIEDRAKFGPYGSGAPWGIYTFDDKDASMLAFLYSKGDLELHDKEINTYPHYHIDGFDIFIAGKKYKHFHFWFGDLIK